MPRENGESTFPESGKEILEDLIKRYYEKLIDEIDKNLKPGDLLKMIELHHKLAPSKAEQEQFWNMIDKIRRDSLGKQSTGVRKPPPTTNKTKVGVKMSGQNAVEKITSK
ncbi:MAG: hypothetical protein ACREBV_02925 [Candidatus Zixiibacteriota bacterium]